MGWKDLLQKEMATHCSIFAWEIPQTEEPGRLQSMGSQKSQTCPSHSALQTLSLPTEATWEVPSKFEYHCLQSKDRWSPAEKAWQSWVKLLSSGILCEQAELN